MAGKCKLPKSYRKEICECIEVLNTSDHPDAPLKPLDAVDSGDKKEEFESRTVVEKNDTTCTCGGITETHRPYPYTWFDIAIAVISIIFYLTDVGTDSWLAWRYFRQERWTYFGLTVAFLCFPSIVMNISSFGWFFADYKTYKTKQNWGHSWLFWFLLNIVFCVFQLGPVLRYGTVIYYGLQSKKKMSEKEKKLFYHLMLEEDKDSCMLRLFECSLEAGPQLILQLYILVHQEEENIHMDTMQVLIQLASVLTSWFGIAWSHVSYHRALRLSREDKFRMSVMGTVFYFGWRLFEVLSRVVALCMFAVEFSYWVFVATAVHWVIMTIWYSCQRIGQAKMFHNSCLDFGFNMLCGAVSIFGFFNVKDGHTRFRCLVYYVMVYLENASFIFLWFFLTSDLGAWFHFPALFAVLLGFFVGVAFQLAYYIMFHPGGKIKFCLPKEECEHSICFMRQGSEEDVSIEMTAPNKPDKGTSHLIKPDCIYKPKPHHV